MDRSTGVYKRNAKGVAIIIDLLIAVISNTDTLHIINQLAKDSTLRAAYSQAATTLVSSNPNALACLQAEQGKVDSSRLPERRVRATLRHADRQHY